MAVPFGKYVLLRKLAEGGMAEIFLAQQAGIEGFARPVVIKRLLPDLTAEGDFVRMFLNEARLAARLNHPNVVQIFELGQEDGAYFLAMEYIRGQDLRSLAQQADVVGIRPPLPLVCRIIAEVLAGLHYAHTRTAPDGSPLGLVHRDISPQNVLVTYDGGVKIIDFGIAKATRRQQSEQTQAGLIKGKYAYMSPEQTRGDKLDGRSDIFAAGILLWELLTWRRLFKRATDLASLVAVSDEPAPVPSTINPEICPELDAICLKSLTIDPAQRYSYAKEFRQALEDLIVSKGWEADTRALGSFMKALFADKIAAAQKDDTEEDVDAVRRPAQLLTMPLPTIDMSAAPKRSPGPSAVPPAKEPPLPTLQIPQIGKGDFEEEAATVPTREVPDFLRDPAAPLPAHIAAQLQAYAAQAQGGETKKVPPLAQLLPQAAPTQAVSHRAMPTGQLPHLEAPTIPARSVPQLDAPTLVPQFSPMRLTGQGAPPASSPGLPQQAPPSAPHLPPPPSRVGEAPAWPQAAQLSNPGVAQVVGSGVGPGAQNGNQPASWPPNQVPPETSSQVTTGRIAVAIFAGLVFGFVVVVLVLLLGG